MLTSSAPPKTYDAKYDILKFVLSIFVVAIHSGLYPLALYPWLRVAVPLFFIMSAYFLFSKLRCAAPEEAHGILKKFAIRNAKLYAFWLVALLPLTLAQKQNLYFAPLGILYFLRDLVFSNTFAASWYIAASVIGVYLVDFLARRLGNRTTLVLLLATFCILTLWSSYPGVLEKNRILYRLLREYTNYFDNPLWSFPVSLFWIFVGKCFAEDRIPLPANAGSVALTAVCTLGLFLEWRIVYWWNGTYNNDSYFMLAPLCILLFSRLQAVGPVTLRYAPFLRRASTVVYTVHYSVVLLLKGANLALFHVESPVKVFFIALLVSLLVYAALECVLHLGKNCKFIHIFRNAY